MDAIGDYTGLTGLPAMVCNPNWLAQWFEAADFTNWGGDGWPDGWVNETDAHDWAVTHGWTASDMGWDWAWNRDGSHVPAAGAGRCDPTYDVCLDYLHGDERRWGSGCTEHDFEYWNASTRDYPIGLPPASPYTSRWDSWREPPLQYISVEDIRAWGGTPPDNPDRPSTRYSCPIANYGISEVQGVPERNYLVGGVGRQSWDERDELFFAPGVNPDAFCGTGVPIPGTTEDYDPQPKLLPADSWAGRSDLFARWVDVDGKPALQFDVKLGADMNMVAWLAFGVRDYSIDGVTLHVTMRPRFCAERLAGTDFCVHRDPDTGSCNRWLALPVEGNLCAPDSRRFDCRPDDLTDRDGDTDVDGEDYFDAAFRRYFPDAEPESGDPVGDELDWNDGLAYATSSAPDGRPEPLVLAANNLLFELDVTAEVNQSSKAHCAGPDILCWIFAAWIVPAVADPEIANAGRKIAAQFFNNMAKVAYFGLRDDSVDHRYVADPCDSDDLGFGAAAYYLRRWFWSPALRLLRRASTSGPIPDDLVASIRFTDISWTTLPPASGRFPLFSFIWDGDNDEVDDDLDNCVGIYNPGQWDWDYDGVGDACEGDADGDRCCEGCATGAGARDCICGNNSDADDPQCVRVDLPGGGSSTCYDQDSRRGFWSGGSARDYDRDTVPDDCDRDRDGDGIDNDDDACPFYPDELNLDWNAPNPTDPRGNVCDDDDDDDGCPDRTECWFRDYEPPDPTQPCGSYACVNGQCRTATEEGQPDDPEHHPCGGYELGGHFVSNCEGVFDVGGEWVDGTCMWDPTRADPYYCDLPSNLEPPLCEILHPPPPIEDVPEGGGPGIPADMYPIHDFDEGSWTITDIIPCPGGIGCCWNARCGEPEVYLTDEFGNVLNTLYVAQATGLDVSAFSEMQVAIVRDINGNRVHDVAISAPYAMGENNTLRGKVFTFDGATFDLLRIREQPGAFGEALGRVEGGLAARVRPLYSFDELATDLSTSATEPIRTGVVITDRWGIESALVRDPNDAYGTFVERITSAWIRDRELAVVYSPTCGGLTDIGCLTGYDQYGSAAWELRGWQSGNELGASFDSDGDYAVVGVPGYNQGTGGLVRVIDLRRNRAWNITQRSRVADFGRHVAIVESAAGPRVVASMLRDGAPRVVQMTLNGQILREHGVPETWEVVGLVSPTLGDGTTDERYAIVYRTDDGWVMHQWFRSSAERAR